MERNVGEKKRVLAWDLRGQKQEADSRRTKKIKMVTGYKNPFIEALEDLCRGPDEIGELVGVDRIFHCCRISLGESGSVQINYTPSLNISLTEKPQRY